ncbi:cation diffusion facilitator family transporter [Peptococcaceae bacterium 1198_IL3148]
MDPKQKVARLSIISNTLLTTGKLSVGLVMGSVGVLSEAIHSGLDLVASIIAYFSVKQSAKPADEQHKYGHGKYENLAAIIEALLIVIAAVAILLNAIPKLMHKNIEIEALGLGMLVMGVSCVVNGWVSYKLMKVAKETDSPALEADALHLRTDVYTSLGVFISIGLIKLTGLTIIDPLVGIFVTLLILKAAYDLLHDSVASMLDTKLPQADEERIQLALEQYRDRFVSYHNLRTRKAGPQRHVDLHLVVPRYRTIAEVHLLCDEIEAVLEKELPRSSILIHSEPCDPKYCDNCNASCQCRKNGVCIRSFDNK